MKRRYTALLVLILVTVLCFAGVNIITSNTKQSESSTEELQPLFSVSKEDVTAISWDTADSTNIRLVQTVQDETSSWSYPQNTVLPLDNTVAESLLDYLISLNVERTLAEPEDLSQYGLDNPSYQFTMETSSGNLTLYIGSENETTGDYYVKFDGQNEVLTVSENPFEQFPESEDELIDVESLPFITAAYVEKISLSTPSGQVELYKEEVTSQTEETSSSSEETSSSSEKTGVEYQWVISLNGEKLSPQEDAVDSLMDAVLNFNFVSCVNYAPDDLSQYGLDNPVYTLSVEYTESEEVKTSVFYIGNTLEDGSVYANKQDGVQVCTLSSDNYNTFVECLENAIQ